MGEPVGIFNWLRYSDKITTSGQPDEDQLSQIRDLGATHIVNLGLHDHEKALPNEISKVLAMNMDYIHIPVQFKCPNEEDFRQFCLAMDELKDETIHLHCIANYRVTAFLYRYVKLRGGDFEKAKNDMLSVWTPDEIWQEFIER